MFLTWTACWNYLGGTSEIWGLGPTAAITLLLVWWTLGSGILKAPGSVSEQQSWEPPLVSPHSVEGYVRASFYFWGSDSWAEFTVLQILVPGTGWSLGKQEWMETSWERKSVFLQLTALPHYWSNWAFGQHKQTFYLGFTLLEFWLQQLDGY